jgi:hypothetical protein
MVDRFANVEPSVGAKWLELLKQISPGVTRAAYSTLFTLLPCIIFFWPRVRSESMPSKKGLRGGLNDDSWLLNGHGMIRR